MSNGKDILGLEKEFKEKSDPLGLEAELLKKKAGTEEPLPISEVSESETPSTVQGLMQQIVPQIAEKKFEEFDPATLPPALDFSTDTQTAAETASLMASAKGTDVNTEFQLQLDTIKATKQKEATELTEYLSKTPSTEKLTFMDRVKEIGTNPIQLVPFLSGAAETKEMFDLMQAANRLDQDIATKKDLLLLKKFSDKGSQDTTFWYDVMDVMAQLPSFALELYATGGIYTAVKKTTTKAAINRLKKLLKEGGKELLEKKITQITTSVASGIVAASAQTVPAGITRITAGTFRNMIPQYEFTEDEQNQIIGSVKKEGDNILLAATKALGEQWIETLSEKSGGLFRSVGKAGKEMMIRHGILSSFLKANPKAKVSDFMKIIRRGGYDGVLSEMAEERVGEIGRFAIGLEEYRLPTGRQLLVELVSFTIPGLTIAGINKTIERKQTAEGIKQTEKEIEEAMPLTETEEAIKEEKVEEPVTEAPKPEYKVFQKPTEEKYGEVIIRDKEGKVIARTELSKERFEEAKPKEEKEPEVKEAEPSVVKALDLRKYKTATEEIYGYIQEEGVPKRTLTKAEFETIEKFETLELTTEEQSEVETVAKETQAYLEERGRGEEMTTEQLTDFYVRKQKQIKLSKLSENEITKIENLVSAEAEELGQSATDFERQGRERKEIDEIERTEEITDKELNRRIEAEETLQSEINETTRKEYPEIPLEEIQEPIQEGRFAKEPAKPTKEIKLTETEKRTNKLLDEIDRFNKLSLSKKKKEPQTRNFIETEASEMGYEFDQPFLDSPITITKEGKKVKRKEAITDTSPVDDFIPLSKRESKVREDILAIINAGDLRGLGLGISGSEAGAISDIKTERNTERAQRVMDILEGYSKEGQVRVSQGSGINVVYYGVPIEEFKKLSRLPEAERVKFFAEEAELLKEAPTEREKKISELHDKNAEIISRLASKIGAKKDIIGSERTSTIKDLQELILNLAEIYQLKGEALFLKLKEQLKDTINTKFLDDNRKEIMSEVEKPTEKLTTKQYYQLLSKIANLGKTATQKEAKKLSIELKNFINQKENLKLLKGLTGITSRTIIKKVSEIGDSPTRLKRTMEYIDNILTKESFKQQEIEKANVIDKTIKLTGEKSLVKKQAGKEVALRPLKSRTDSGDRINKLRSIHKQIVEGNAEEAQEKINNIINELEARRETGKGEQNLTDQELDRIETLEFAEIWDMEIEQMKAMLGKIKEIRDNAKTKAKEEREQRHEVTKERNLHTLKELIPEGKKLLRGSKKNMINKRTHTFAEEGMIDFLWDSSFKSLLNKLSLFRTEKSNILEEWFTKTFYNDLVKKAEDAEIKSDREFKDRKQEALERILKAKGGKLKNKIIDGRIEEIRDVSIINEKGEKEKLYLSQLTALQKWMEYKDPTLTETFHKKQKDGGMGWTEETLNQLEEYITPEWKSIGEWILGEYQTNYDKYNVAYRREYGVDMPKNPFYVPIVRERGMFTDKPMDLLEKQTVQIMVSNGHLKVRQKNTNPLVYTDALDTFNMQVKKMTAFTNWAEPIRVLNETFKDKDVKEAIAQFHGTEYNKVMNWFIERFAGVEQKHQVVALDKAIRNLGKGILYVKIAIGAKQTISTIMYSTDMPIGKLSTEIAKQLSNPFLFKERMDAITSTEFWKNRGEQGFDLDIPAPESKHNFKYRKTHFGKALRNLNIKKEKLFNKLPLNILNSLAAAPIKYGDLMPIALGGSAYYGYKLNLYSKTMSHEQAKEKALIDFELFSEATQQSTRISNISYLRGSSSYARALFMFTTGAGQIHRYVASAYREVRQGRNVVDNLKRIVIAHGIMGAMFGIVGNGLKWDDEEMAWSFLLGNLRGVAFIGQLVAFIKDIIQKKPWAKALQVSPVIKNISEIFINGIELGRELNNEFPDEVKTLEYGQKLATELATNRGIPASGGVKLYKGVSRVIRGESENPIRETLGIDNEWAEGVELWEIFYPRPTKHIRKHEAKETYIDRRSKQEDTIEEEDLKRIKKEYDIYSTKDDRVIYFYESKGDNFKKAKYLYKVFAKDGNEETYKKLKSLGLISDNLKEKYKTIKDSPDITKEELKILEEKPKPTSPFALPKY